jgi:hypothetical protein
VNHEAFQDWGLPSFPEVLCTLPKLARLCLQNQQLLAIPPAIASLCHLRDLTLT